MVTIKSIAQQAHVSPSTVSIVLNGKAKERKISPETEARILKIIAETGYQPNVQAVNLRNVRSPFQYRIIIFWVADSRAQTMIRFFKGVENEIERNEYSCEILLKSYKLGNLKEAMTEELLLSSHGIIICNSSEEDLEFLENNEFPRPIVLYNRYSSKYHSVNMDDKKIGILPAEIFHKRHRSKPAIIAAPATFNGMTMRTNIFSYSCLEYGMASPVICSASDSKRGGYEAAQQLLKDHPDTDCIFFSGDTMALGALRAFHESKIKIPDSLDLIAVGNNLKDQCDVSYPSISVVYLPIEDLAAKCLLLLYEQMIYKHNLPDSITIPISYIARESCPEISDSAL